MIYMIYMVLLQLVVNKKYHIVNVLRHGKRKVGH